MSHFKFATDSKGTQYILRILTNQISIYTGSHMKFVYTEDGEEISYSVSSPNDTACVHMIFQ